VAGALYICGKCCQVSVVGPQYPDEQVIEPGVSDVVGAAMDAEDLPMTTDDLLRILLPAENDALWCEEKNEEFLAIDSQFVDQYAREIDNFFCP